MSPIAITLIYLVAALHLVFLVMEMFLWETPTGRRSFGTSVEQAAQSKALAANQGLYNGFLAAGLVWGALTDQRPVAIFFLICVAVAGVFGAITVNSRIFMIQALPALIAIAFLWT